MMIDVYGLKYMCENNVGLQKQLMKLRSWTMVIDMYVSIQWYGRNDVNYNSYYYDLGYQMIQNVYEEIDNFFGV
eukprot:14870881-Heterocapsa_arctica.AAC.1